MKTSMFLMVAAMLFGAHAATAQNAATSGSTSVTSQPGKATMTEVLDVTATIAGINPGTRTITLKGPNRTVDVVAGDEVRNFDQLRLGDRVAVRYQRALELELQKTRSNAAPASATVIQRAQPGQAPGGAIGRSVSLLAEVVAVDPKKNVISLKGPRGNVVDLDVKNPDHFKVVKKGDQVAVVYTEALAVAVTPVASTSGKKTN